MSIINTGAYNNTYWFHSNLETSGSVLVLPKTTSTLSQIITIKESSGYISSILYLSTAFGDRIEGNNSVVILSTLQSCSLQSISSSVWSALSFYSNVRFISGNPVGATIVNASDKYSSYNVDLRTQSKIVVLPNTYMTSTGNLFVTVKDLYGSASTNNLFLSTPNNMFIEGGNFTYSTIMLTSSFASLELLANSNRYSVLNSYP